MTSLIVWIAFLVAAVILIWAIAQKTGNAKRLPVRPSAASATPPKAAIDRAIIVVGSLFILLIVLPIALIIAWFLWGAFLWITGITQPWAKPALERAVATPVVSTERGDAGVLIEKTWQMANSGRCTRILPGNPVVISLNPGAGEICKTSPLVLRGLYSGQLQFANHTGASPEILKNLRFDGTMRGLDLSRIKLGTTYPVLSEAQNEQTDCLTLFWVGKENPNRDIKLTAYRKNFPMALIVRYEHVTWREPIELRVPVRTAPISPRIDSDVFIIVTSDRDTPMHNEAGELRLRFDPTVGPLESHPNPVWKGSTQGFEDTAMLMFRHTYAKPATIYVVVAPK